MQMSTHTVTQAIEHHAPEATVQQHNHKLNFCLRGASKSALLIVSVSKVGQFLL